MTSFILAKNSCWRETQAPKVKTDNSSKSSQLSLTKCNTAYFPVPLGSLRRCTADLHLLKPQQWPLHKVCPHNRCTARSGQFFLSSVPSKHRPLQLPLERSDQPKAHLSYGQRLLSGEQQSTKGNALAAGFCQPQAAGAMPPGPLLRRERQQGGGEPKGVPSVSAGLQTMSGSGRRGSVGSRLRASCEQALPSRHGSGGAGPLPTRKGTARRAAARGQKGERPARTPPQLEEDGTAQLQSPGPAQCFPARLTPLHSQPVSFLISSISSSRSSVDAREPIAAPGPRGRATLRAEESYTAEH